MRLIALRGLRTRMVLIAVKLTFPESGMQYSTTLKQTTRQNSLIH
jgi:hypothetical protein